MSNYATALDATICAPRAKECRSGPPAALVCGLTAAAVRITTIYFHVAAGSTAINSYIILLFFSGGFSHGATIGHPCRGNGGWL